MATILSKDRQNDMNDNWSNANEANFFFRYQKKIGTYDKQQWERTIEQHILDGITHVPMRTTKLKTELIDVDLVRGRL